MERDWVTCRWTAEQRLLECALAGQRVDWARYKDLGVDTDRVQHKLLLASELPARMIASEEPLLALA